MALDVIKIKNIFLEALAKPTAQERYAFVEQACENDQESLDYIKGMLDAHERYATPVPEGTTKFEPAPNNNQNAYPPGTIIDQKYKVIELIAEGGMGSVYRASRITELRMEVALKIIKPGMDSRQVLNRFNLERQALALMSHENIAKVYDAGTTESGLPYFVMELVKGSPLTTFCDNHKLSVQERLALFEKICSGVQHAHQKGIVHRDLKPNNILIGMYDDKPVPKIIDFGLAKAMHQPLLEESFHTRIGTFVGTWQYTAPEQAQFNNLDVDTRADIYSLGVILYELLTGQTPIERAKLKHAAYNEVLRLIREEEPPKPSTKIHSSDQLPSIAALRRVEPVKLERMVRGELDWIVMKALEKDRNRRYATANEFGADILHYLHDEPVQAGPPTVSYRLSKLIHKHRGKVAVATLLAATVLTGTVVSVLGWMNASREKNRADHQVRVTQTVNDFLREDLLSEGDPAVQVKPGEAFTSNLTVKQALDKAADKVGTRFVNQPLIEAAIRHTIGKTYLSLGETSKARFHLEKSEQLRRQHAGENDPDRLETLHELGMLLIMDSQFKQADEVIRDVVKRRETVLGPSDAATLRSRYLLGLSLQYQEKHEEAKSVLQNVLDEQRKLLGIRHMDTLATQRELADSLINLGQLAQAEQYLKEVLQVQEEILGKQHPSTFTTTNELALLQIGKDAPAVAETMFRQLVIDCGKSLGAEHPKTLTYQSNLAIALAMQKKYPEAIEQYRQTIPLMKKVFGITAHNSLNGGQNLAALLLMTDKFQEAEPLLLDVYQGCKATLGDKHEKTKLVIESLVELYRRMKNKEKEVQYQQLLK